MICCNAASSNGSFVTLYELQNADFAKVTNCALLPLRLRTVTVHMGSKQPFDYKLIEGLHII